MRVRACVCRGAFLPAFYLQGGCWWARARLPRRRWPQVALAGPGGARGGGGERAAPNDQWRPGLRRARSDGRGRPLLPARRGRMKWPPDEMPRISHAAAPAAARPGPRARGARVPRSIQQCGPVVGQQAPAPPAVVESASGPGRRGRGGPRRRPASLRGVGAGRGARRGCPARARAPRRAAEGRGRGRWRLLWSRGPPANEGRGRGARARARAARRRPGRAPARRAAARKAAGITSNVLTAVRGAASGGARGWCAAGSVAAQAARAQAARSPALPVRAAGVPLLSLRREASKLEPAPRGRGAAPRA